ncbi:MAG: ribonuclease BN [Alphaproteobacteria bacterium]|nr:MAG: ribonuclease BN [Alphaproteobacteria bacterium]
MKQITETINRYAFTRDIAKTFKQWIANDPLTQSAATSYYAIFSLPGLLILIVGFTGLFLKKNVIEAEISHTITETFGANAAENIQIIVERTKIIGDDPLMILVGFMTLFLAATGVFMQLQRSLNVIWGIKNKKTKSYIKYLKMRLISLSMIVVIGFLLMMSLTITTALTAIATWLSSYIPAIFLELVLSLNILISWSIITLLFTIIFSVMPDARTKFKYCLAGGLLSAMMFKLGESALQYYFSQIKPDSAFGATGFLVLIMIWVFYSCNILLLGANYTKILAGRSVKKDPI